MTGYIYTLSKNGAVFYVGQTLAPEVRQTTHLLNYRGNGISFEIVEEFSAGEDAYKKEMFNLERYWIDQFRQWGFLLINQRGNLSVYDGIKKTKRICFVCNQLIGTHDKYSNVGAQKIHRDCNPMESYFKVSKK